MLTTVLALFRFAPNPALVQSLPKTLNIRDACRLSCLSELAVGRTVGSHEERTRQ